jgi:hypothetical protein
MASDSESSGEGGLNKTANNSDAPPDDGHWHFKKGTTNDTSGSSIYGWYVTPAGSNMSYKYTGHYDPFKNGGALWRIINPNLKKPEIP